jgi:hypothetical protein
MRGQIIFGVQTWGPWKNSLIRQGNKGARGGPPLARNAKAAKVRRALKFPAPLSLSLTDGDTLLSCVPKARFLPMCHYKLLQ